jgi:hypothetical protein
MGSQITREHFPEAVTEVEDTPLMVDHSKLVPALWALVQEQQTRIEALEQAQHTNRGD